MDIQTYIKDVVSSQSSELSGTNKPLNEDNLLSALRERGLVDKVLQQMHFTNGATDLPFQEPHRPATHFINKEDDVRQTLQPKKSPIDPTRRYLYLQVNGGKAFLEHLNQDPSPLPGKVSFLLSSH